MKRIGRPKKNAYLAINKENWTTIKGKEIDKDLRKVMPAKKDIWNKKGELIISQEQYEQIVKDIDILRRIPKHQRPRIDTALNEEIQGLKQYVRELDIKAELKSKLTTEISAAELEIRLMSEDMARDFQNKLKHVKWITNGLTYNSSSDTSEVIWSFKNYASKGTFNFNAIPKQDWDLLYVTIQNEPEVLTALTEEQYKELYEYINGTDKGLDEEYKYYQDSNIVKVQQKVQQLTELLGILNKRDKATLDII